MASGRACSPGRRSPRFIARSRVGGKGAGALNQAPDVGATRQMSVRRTAGRCRTSGSRTDCAAERAPAGRSGQLSAGWALVRPPLTSARGVAIWRRVLGLRGGIVKRRTDPHGTPGLRMRIRAAGRTPGPNGSTRRPPAPQRPFARRSATGPSRSTGPAVRDRARPISASDGVTRLGRGWRGPAQPLSGARQAMQALSVQRLPMPHFGQTFIPSVETPNGESLPSGVVGGLGRERIRPSAASATTAATASRRSRWVWSTAEPSTVRRPPRPPRPGGRIGSARAYDAATSPVIPDLRTCATLVACQS